MHGGEEYASVPSKGSGQVAKRKTNRGQARGDPSVLAQAEARPRLQVIPGPHFGGLFTGSAASIEG